MEVGMRNLLLGVFCLGVMAGTALATSTDDIIEFGLGARFMLNGDTYYGDNTDVNYGSDGYPFVGSQGLGLGTHLGIGHRFDSRRGSWEFVLGYDYFFGFEDSGERVFTENNSVLPPIKLEGKLRQHDFMMTFRMPFELLPLDIISLDGAFIELAPGVTTLAYEYWPAGFSEATVKKVRSGLNLGFGLGYALELENEYSLLIRGNMTFGQIQDVENTNGVVVHASPRADNLRLSISLRKYFKAWF
jgi:hypothetical protein